MPTGRRCWRRRTCVGASHRGAPGRPRRGGLKASLFCISDGTPVCGAPSWARATLQRCCVHRLRNLERKVFKHVLDEFPADFHRIVYAGSADAARAAWTAFERAWRKWCPGVVKGLRKGVRGALAFPRRSGRRCAPTAATGQIVPRKLDGYAQVAAVIRPRTRPAARSAPRYPYGRRD